MTDFIIASAPEVTPAQLIIREECVKRGINIRFRYNDAGRLCGFSFSEPQSSMAQSELLTAVNTRLSKISKLKRKGR